MTGNGRPATIRTNAAAAIATPAAVWITRLPTRITAAATSAITAAPRPRTMPATDGHLAVLDVDRAHPAQQHEGGQHEQAAGGDRAAHAVHRVADVGGQLLGLGAGQRHAEVEGVQEPPLARSNGGARPARRA